MSKKIIEPFRIKAVENIKLTTKAYRKEIIKKAGYNLFNIKSKDVYIDLLTDSGTGAMSDSQWAALMKGDESYAGSKNYYNLCATVEELTGFTNVIPTHQGRGAEQILFPALIKGNKNITISNMHFDTTKAHVELNGAKALDFVTQEAFNTQEQYPFKGNFNVQATRDYIHTKGSKHIAFIVITVTCNSAGGQPISMQNIKEISHLAKQYGVVTILDCARFAENAYFIKQREQGYRDVSIRDIVKEMFSYADAFTMSAKKDGLVNIGGLVGIHDEELFDKVKSLCVPYEGYITYGGLAGRDMEALSIGLQEVVDQGYLEHRIAQIEYLGNILTKNDIPIQTPVGGHAIFIDAKKMLPHIKSKYFPAQVLACELYIDSGTRGVEVGSFLVGNDPITKQQAPSSFEFLRLTIPRRTYTYTHLEYVAESICNIKENLKNHKGFRIVREPKVLRHFTAVLVPLT